MTSPLLVESATRKESGAGPATTSGAFSRPHARAFARAATSARSSANGRRCMAPELPRRARRRNQRRSDRLEVRGRVEEIVSGVIEDPVERALGLDAEHLVDAAQREVMAAAGLVTSGVHEPWLRADALYECRRLPRGRHRLPRPGRME